MIIINDQDRRDLAELDAAYRLVEPLCADFTLKAPARFARLFPPTRPGEVVCYKRAKLRFVSPSVREQVEALWRETAVRTHGQAPEPFYEGYLAALKDVLRILFEVQVQ